MRLYGIKNCDTVKKARNWLDQHGLTYSFHDLRVDGLDGALISRWQKAVATEVLLNRRSTTWKNLTSQVRDSLEEKDIPALLIANPTLVKRPVLEHGDQVIVGFNDKTYKAFFDL